MAELGPQPKPLDSQGPFDKQELEAGSIQDLRDRAEGAVMTG